MNYIVCISGDCNDADYANDYYVMNEIEFDYFQDLLKSVKKLEKIAKPHLKYDHAFGAIRDALDDYDYSEINPEYLKRIDEWFIEECLPLKQDILNFREFLDWYCPSGTSDEDKVHTLKEILAFRLVNDEPINLLND